MSVLEMILGAAAVRDARGWGALRAQVLALAGGHGRIVEHRQKAWASITFSGSRHTLAIEFEGAAAVEGGEDLVTVLPENEFAIPGQLVADAIVTEVDHAVLPKPKMRVVAELLLLEEE